VFNLDNGQDSACKVIAKVSDVTEVDENVIQVVHLVKERIKNLRKMTRAKFDIQNIALDYTSWSETDILCTECYKVLLKVKDLEGMNEHCFLGFKQCNYQQVVKKD